MFSGFRLYALIGLIALASAVGGYIYYLKSELEITTLNNQTLKTNIKEMKVAHEQEMSAAVFKAKQSAKKKSIEKSIKKDNNVKSNPISNNDRFYL